MAFVNNTLKTVSSTLHAHGKAKVKNLSPPVIVVKVNVIDGGGV